ncbi:MAG: hypothetical protein ACI8RD_011536 [Bacillariaceae sp.]|jgi:hypothetical protein
MNLQLLPEQLLLLLLLTPVVHIGLDLVNFHPYQWPEVGREFLRYQQRPLTFLDDTFQSMVLDIQISLVRLPPLWYWYWYLMRCFLTY